MDVVDKMRYIAELTKRTRAPYVSLQGSNTSRQMKKRLRTRIDGAGPSTMWNEEKKEKPATKSKVKGKPRRAGS